MKDKKEKRNYGLHEEDLWRLEVLSNNLIEASEYLKSYAGEFASLTLQDNQTSEISKSLYNLKNNLDNLHYSSMKLQKKAELLKNTVVQDRESQGNMLVLNAKQLHLANEGRDDDISDNTWERWRMIRILERTQYKESLISIVEDELKNSLTCINDFSDLLLEQSYGPLNKEQVDFMRIVKKSAKDMLILINQILTSSKVEEDKIVVDFQKLTSC